MRLRLRVIHEHRLARSVAANAQALEGRAIRAAQIIELGAVKTILANSVVAVIKRIDKMCDIGIRLSEVHPSWSHSTSAVGLGSQLALAFDSAVERNALRALAVGTRLLLVLTSHCSCSGSVLTTRAIMLEHVGVEPKIFILQRRPTDVDHASVIAVVGRADMIMAARARDVDHAARV